MCAIICPLILTLDPSRGPQGELKKTLGGHRRSWIEGVKFKIASKMAVISLN